MGKLSAKLALVNERGAVDDAFSLIDFNFGSAFNDMLGPDFDKSRMTNFVVAQTVLRQIIGQRTMIFAKYVDDISVKLLDAFRKKLMLREAVIVVEELLYDAPQSPFWPSRATPRRQMAQIDIHDITITSISPRLKVNMAKPIDVVTVTMNEFGSMT